MKQFWMLACLMIVCAGSSAFGGQPPVADCEKAQTIRKQVASNESMPSDVKKASSTRLPAFVRGLSMCQVCWARQKGL